MPEPALSEGFAAFEAAEIDSEGRLLLHCERGDAMDLTRPEVLRAVLEKLRDHPQARVVALIGERERAFGPRAMAALHHLLGLGRLMDRFAERAPTPDFPGFTAKEMEAVCATCAFRPATMFASLRDRLLGDPEAFLAALADLVASLEGEDEPGCSKCLRATVEDVRTLVDEVKRFRA